MNKYSPEDVVKFIDPIFRFCMNHLNNYHDAEDLASEIMMHVIDGFDKYEINSLESWVWKIVHNRYARLINKRKNSPSTISDEILMTFSEYDDSIDNVVLNDEYLSVYKALHSLSADYRNIAIDYYIGEMTVRDIAQYYSITETTVKWRLNISREKIKNRIGDYEMDKIYKRINWNTNTCNGSFNPSQYLNSQIKCAICEAAYEKPLTIEEISMRTGLPAMYIEDEMDNLLYGDAIVKEGNKYSTNFIIFRLKDRERLKEHIKPIIKDCADYYEKLFVGKENIDKLGYIIIPETIRNLIFNSKDELGYSDGAYPKRQDGGYGWFIVSEVPNENELVDPYSSGCNHYSSDNQEFLYYWIGRYHANSYNNKYLRLIRDNGFTLDNLNESQLIEILKYNLIIKDGNGYKLNMPCFTEKSFYEFIEPYKVNSDEIHELVKQLIIKIHEAFVMFTPKHLESQINQYISSFMSGITSYIVEELQSRSVLKMPEDNLLTYNIYYIDRR